MQCSVYIAASLDGFIAGADDSLDFLSVVQRDGEDYGYAKFAASVDVLVMGRRTYDTALGFPAWPYTGKRVVVLTHRPATAGHGEEFFAGTVAELVRKLAGEGARRAYIDGGGVIRQFLAAGLIDDVTLSVIPVLLGRGVRLFGDDGPQQALVMDGVQSWSTGLVQLRYRRA